jgi:hypothetical protein
MTQRGVDFATKRHKSRKKGERVMGGRWGPRTVTDFCLSFILCVCPASAVLSVVNTAEAGQAQRVREGILFHKELLTGEGLRRLAGKLGAGRLVPNFPVLNLPAKKLSVPRKT